MKRRRPGRAATGLVAVLAVALAAPLLAPLPPHRVDDVAGARWLPPLTRVEVVRLDTQQTLVLTRLADQGSTWSAVRAGQPVTIDPGRVVATSRRTYWLGTDSLGRDVASRVLYGLRHSIVLATLAVLLGLVAGIAVAAAAALGGPGLDAVLMRLIDAVLALPLVLVFLLLAAFCEPSWTLLVLVLGGLGWPVLARLARAELMASRHAGFVEAARAAGGSRRRLLLGHLLPQLGPVIAVTSALRVADTMLLESALSFLGLGAPPPSVSLGEIVADGRDALGHAWWATAIPVAALAAAVLAVRLQVSAVFRSSEPPSVL